VLLAAGLVAATWWSAGAISDSTTANAVVPTVHRQSSPEFASFHSSAPVPPPPEVFPRAIVKQARALASEEGSTWDRAARLRDLVRATLKNASCSTLALGFWSLGTTVGLPLRLVVGSANGLNLFDTHSTVEVWLDREHRWVITDPTFDGYWTSGPSGRKLGVSDISRAVADGSVGDVYWHAAGAKNSIEPSSYYVDPVLLYRYFGVRAFVKVNAGSGGYIVNNLTNAGAVGTVYIPSNRVAAFDASPTTAIGIKRVVQSATLTSPNEFVIPPPYTDGAAVVQTVPLSPDGDGVVFWRRTVRDTSGVGVLRLDVPNSGIASASMVSARTKYALRRVGKSLLSPIVSLGEVTRFRVSGVPAGTTVTVTIYRVRTFPQSNIAE